MRRISKAKRQRITSTATARAFGTAPLKAPSCWPSSVFALGVAVSKASPSPYPCRFALKSASSASHAFPDAVRSSQLQLLSSSPPADDNNAVFAVLAVPRSALRREVRVAAPAAPPAARAFRGDDAVQCAVRLLRLLEDAGVGESERAEELRRSGALLRSAHGLLHRRGAAAQAGSRGSRGGGEPGGSAQVHHAHHTWRDAHRRARALALGRGDQPVQHLARFPGRAARS